MTQRKALGDLDFDSAFDDPDNGWFGHVQAVDHTEDDPQSVAAPSAEDTDRWPVAMLDETPEPHVEEPPRAEEPPRPPGRRTFDLHEVVSVRRPSVDPRPSRLADTPPVTRPSRESRLAGSGAWDFKVSPSGPRNRSKFALAAVIVAAVAVAVTAAVLLVRNPDPAADEPATVTPGGSTAQPAPASTPGPIHAEPGAVAARSTRNASTPTAAAGRRDQPAGRHPRLHAATAERARQTGDPDADHPGSAERHPATTAASQSRLLHAGRHPQTQRLRFLTRADARPSATRYVVCW